MFPPLQVGAGKGEGEGVEPGLDEVLRPSLSSVTRGPAVRNQALKYMFLLAATEK